jgi:hypothetical protein
MNMAPLIKPFGTHVAAKFRPAGGSMLISTVINKN